MRIVVLGATGGLGGRLARHFNSENQVLAQGRNVEKLTSLASIGSDFVQGGLDDAVVISAVTTFAPDVIINACGKSGFSRGRVQYAKANINTVENAIVLARAAKNCRLIHFSSPSVSYRAQDCLNIPEDKPFSPPVNGYAWSRQQSELLLQTATDLPVTIIRLRSAYGYSAPSPLETIRQKIIKKKLLPLVRGGQVKIDLVHVDDVAAALDAILQQPQHTGSKVFNVAGPEALTFKQIAESIAVHENVKTKWLPIPGIALAFAGPIAEIMMTMLPENREPDISAHMAGSLLYSQTLDLSQMKEFTGWSPKITLDEAVARQIL